MARDGAPIFNNAATGLGTKNSKAVPFCNKKNPRYRRQFMHSVYMILENMIAETKSQVLYVFIVYMEIDLILQFLILILNDLRDHSVSK